MSFFQPSHSVSGPSKKSSTESSKGGQICDSSSEVSDEGYKSSQGISLKNNHQPCSQEGLGQAAPSDDSKTKNNSSTKISDKTAEAISKDSCSDVALSSNSSQEGNGKDIYRTFICKIYFFIFEKSNCAPPPFLQSYYIILPGPTFHTCLYWVPVMGRRRKYSFQVLIYHVFSRF